MPRLPPPLPLVYAPFPGVLRLPNLAVLGLRGSCSEPFELPSAIVIADPGPAIEDVETVETDPLPEGLALRLGERVPSLRQVDGAGRERELDVRARTRRGDPRPPRPRPVKLLPARGRAPRPDRGLSRVWSRSGPDAPLGCCRP